MIRPSDLKSVTSFLRRQKLAHLRATCEDGVTIVVASDVREHVRLSRVAPGRWGGAIFSIDEWFPIGRRDVYRTLTALLRQLPISYGHVLEPASARRAPRSRAPGVPRLRGFGRRLEALLSSGTAAGDQWVVLLAWEGWDEDDYPSKEAFRVARGRFDARFAEAREKVEARLGPPASVSKEKGTGYARAAWPVRGGVLALEQSERDISEGLTIELHLSPARRIRGRARGGAPARARSPSSKPRARARPAPRRSARA